MRIALRTAVQVAGIEQIDHLIVTHYHVDHFGGAATLAAAMPIKHVHDNGKFEGLREPPDKAYLELKTERRRVTAPARRFHCAGPIMPMVRHYP